MPRKPGACGRHSQLKPRIAAPDSKYRNISPTAIGAQGETVGDAAEQDERDQQKQQQTVDKIQRSFLFRVVVGARGARPPAVLQRQQEAYPEGRLAAVAFAICGPVPEQYLPEQV